MVCRGQHWLIFILSSVLNEVSAQTIVPGFTVPSKICSGEVFNITNTTTGGNTFEWNFCAKDLNQDPILQDLGGFGMLGQPTYLDVVFTNNNYYAFITNFSSGDLVRLDFGNSLLNTPTAVNLGDVNAVLPRGGVGGIEVVRNEGKWYAIIVAGHPPGGINPSILKIEFGTDITNTNPTGEDWGNLGNMYDPNDLILVQEGDEWLGITVNGETNTITRFDFNSSFDNPPVATNIGNIGSLEEPAGLYLAHENGRMIVFVTNSGDENRIGGKFEITRLDFGNSFTNNPVAVNIGNVGNQLQHPRDMVLVPFCNETLGYVLNAHPFYNSLLKLDFNNSILSLPTSAELSHQAFKYPHSITDFYSFGDDLVALVVNRESSTISRVVFSDCSNASIPTSNAQNPPALSYNTAGIYNIQLMIDKGMPSETSVCRQVVVSNCTDTLIITNDTTLCAGTSINILTHPAISYQWSPSTYLNDPRSNAPLTTPQQNITYYVDALVAGDNLVTNGDFSNGNNGFQSAYTYTPTNVVEGEYFVGNDPKTWNVSLDYCSDHTTGMGQMLLVNGAPVAGKQVWSQTVNNLMPGTAYGFSAWLQALWAASAANLQFLVNGVPVGTLNASIPACNWSQFESVWNSGANTSAVLSIVDLNTTVAGNDFAIDDISFAELVPVRDSILITVKQPFIKASNDTTICAGAAVPLDVNEGAFFTWSPAAGLSNAGVPNPVATPLVTTEYTVVAIDPSGCLARDTVLITVKPGPTIITSPDTSICIGSSGSLSASGGVTYQWTPSTYLNDPSSPTPVTSAPENITYKIKVTAANACAGEDSVKINVRQYPAFTSSGPQTVCAGNPVTIEASGGDVYQWTPAAGLPNAGLPSVTFIPPASELYAVNIRDTVCAFDTTMQVQVTVNPMPVLSVRKLNDVNCTSPVTQLEVSGANEYTWSPAKSLDNANIANPVASPDTTTTYSVSGTNEFGCTSSAFVMVNVSKDGASRFVVPNAFTPNQDGKNDCFGIQRWGNATVKQFSVYNRWGTLVFQSTDVSKCWDGTWRGTPQPAGGYIYIIKAVTLCGEVTSKGMLTLIR